MFIYEGNRVWVEQQLRSLQADQAVARACAEAKVLLDGTDSIFALCEVDDRLHERLGIEASPLQPPPGWEEPPQPTGRRPHPLDGAIAFKTAQRRAKESGDPPPSRAEFEGAFKARTQGATEAWARFQALPRYRHPRRSRVERVVANGQVDLQALLESIERTPERRADHRAFCQRIEALRERAEALAEFGSMVHTAFYRLGYTEEPFFIAPESFDLDEVVQRSFGAPLSPEATVDREWLLTELALSRTRPVRLANRSPEASRIARRSQPFKVDGPASLLEGAETWLESWGPEDSKVDLSRVETYAIEQVQTTAARVAELIASGVAWHEEEAGEVRFAGRRRLIRSLGAVFHGVVSFDGGFPGRTILVQLMLDGVFEPGLLAMPPSRNATRKKATADKASAKIPIKKKIRKKRR